MNGSKKSVRIYLITIITFVATILALAFPIAIYLIQRASGETEISAQVLSNDELTLYASEAELNARFSYAGEDVAHLWKTEVRFINSGYGTVIGKGSMKNIISDEGLNFVYPENTRILRVQEIDENLEAKLIQTGENNVQVQFSQWRANEYVLACFYIASEEPLSVNPLPSVTEREIIDGNVIIEDFTKKEVGKRRYAIDVALKGFARYGKIMGGILDSVLIIVLFGLFLGGWIGYIRLSSWKKKYFEGFLKHLPKIKPPLGKELIDFYIKHPDTTPADCWEDFKGKKSPSKLQIFDDLKDALLSSVVLIILLIGFLSLLLSIIPV